MLAIYCSKGSRDYRSAKVIQVCYSSPYVKEAQMPQKQPKRWIKKNIVNIKVNILIKAILIPSSLKIISTNAFDLYSLTNFMSLKSLYNLGNLDNLINLILATESIPETN